MKRAAPPLTNVAFERSRMEALALLLAAAVMLVPANLLPVIKMDVPGEGRIDTIFSSIVGLFQKGLWPLGVIVFTASMLVPFLKLVGLGWLIFATRRGPVPEARWLTRVYASLEFIGRWSMLDVFLVGFLSGAVRFDAFATVEPRAGIVAFAAAVVLTILATKSFDPRGLWDVAPESVRV